MKKIKAWAIVSEYNGFRGAINSKAMAELVASLWKKKAQRKYEVVSCEIILKRSLRSPKKKISK